MQGRMAGLGSRKGLANAKSSECISVTISRIKFLLSCAKSTPIHLGALPLLSLSIYTHLGVDYSPPPAGLRVNFPEGTLGTSLVGLKADVRLAVQGTTYA